VLFGLRRDSRQTQVKRFALLWFQVLRRRLSQSPLAALIAATPKRLAFGSDSPKHVS